MNADTELNSSIGAQGIESDGRRAPSWILDRKLPPVAELAVLSVMLMLAGGVYLAAHLPRQPPLLPATVLLAGGGLLTVGSMILLVRIRPFAWKTFFTVFRWALLAYAVIAGLLGFVFIYDHTRGVTLVVLLLTLVVFAVDVPMIIAFTVARYDASESDAP
ncbi:MAG TPA: hypothetical protein VMU77_03630 [Acidimicrobiales bacterium]|nr:hypothetical protein [Acidimicrobiales bacterium]